MTDTTYSDGGRDSRISPELLVARAEVFAGSIWLACRLVQPNTFPPRQSGVTKRSVQPGLRFNTSIFLQLNVEYLSPALL